MIQTIKNAQDGHRDITLEVVEQVRKCGEESAYLIVRHYWSGALMFAGWVKGPDYRVNLCWLT